MAAYRPPGEVPGHGERGTPRHSGLTAATTGRADGNANGRTCRDGEHVKALRQAPHRIRKDWYSHMGSTKKTRPEAALEATVCILAWCMLYGAPEAIFHAEYADRRHVLLEGAAALLLLVPALRDGPMPAPEGSGKPRYARLAAALVPALLASYAAAQMYGLADTLYVDGPASAFFPDGGYAWYALRTCATAPLMEELGCRWIAFGGLRRRGAGFWPSVLVSAALFSFIHLHTNPAMAVGCIPSALLLCLLYETTGAPWASVAAHAANNLLTQPSTAWPLPVPERMLYGVPRGTSIPVLLTVTAAIALLCAFRKKLFYRHVDGGTGPDHVTGRSRP